MSRQPQHMEDFIRRKLAEKEFPYQESYWQTAQSQMKAWETRRRITRVGVFLLLLAAGGVLWYLGLWRGERLPLPVTELPGAGKFPEKQTGVSINGLAEYQTKGRELAIAKPGKPEISGTPSAEKTRTNISRPLLMPAWGNATGVIGKAVSENRSGETAESNSGSLPSTGNEKKEELPALSVPSAPTLGGDWAVILPAARKGNILPSFSGRQKGSLIIQVGGVAYRELENEDQRRRVMLSPILGLQARFPLGRHWEAGAGLQYFFRKGINRQQSRRSLVYDFIATETRNTFVASELHYLALPVELGFRVGGRHRLFAGPTLLYLLNVRGELQESKLNTLGESSTVKNQAWGYTRGFSSWDWGLGLGYGLRLSPNWELTLSGYWALRDLADDGVFSFRSDDRNHRLVFSLGYNLK